MNSKVVQLHRERNKTIGRPKKPEIKSEAWVKDRVKEIFAQFGNDRPYMPPPALYGSAGASDFIECVYGRYVAIETKRLGCKQTKMQVLFEEHVTEQGGI